MAVVSLLYKATAESNNAESEFSPTRHAEISKCAQSNFSSLCVILVIIRTKKANERLRLHRRVSHTTTRHLLNYKIS